MKKPSFLLWTIVLFIQAGNSQSIIQLTHSPAPPSHLTLFNNKIYFRWSDSSKLDQVFSADTTGKIEQITFFTHTPDMIDLRISEIFVFNNKLFIQTTNRHSNQPPSSYLTDIYVSDGTPRSEYLFSGIPNTQSNCFSKGQYGILNNRLYYFYSSTMGISTNNPIFKLWSSDGTQGGAVLINTFNHFSSTPSTVLLQPYSNSLYVLAGASSHPDAVWKIDANNSVSVLKDIKADNFFLFNNMLNFYEDGSNILWLTNGQTTGTHPWLDNSNASIQAMTYIPTPALFKGKAYFFDKDHHLCVSDGVVVSRIKDFSNRTKDYFSPTMGGCGNLAFFGIRNNTTNTLELWSSDGTTNGTVLFKTLYTGTTSQGAIGPISTYPIGNKLYFTSANTTSMTDIDFWVIDADDNYAIRKVFPYTIKNGIDGSIQINNCIYGVCDYNNSGVQLFKFSL